MAELKRGLSTQPLPSPGPFLAIVVNNLDPTYMGSLEVSVLRKVGANLTPSPETQVVRYCSPFLGQTAIKYEGADSANFNDAQKSYGFWAIPPDIGATVMVIFLEGDPNQGYWTGCVQDTYQNFMMPGLAATKNVEITPEQERKYGTRNLPTSEFNKKTRSIGDDGTGPAVSNFNKPIHPFADRLLAQGLILDTIRGITSSSARREVPSSVFGISTPGPLDPDGKKAPPVKGGSPVPVSRLGGTTFVMDDGDEKGESELVRIRTRTGHQILMHNSQDLIYIANSKGTAWVEFTSDGKIDIYANDSISIHSEGDFNFRADRDINIEALRNINMYAGQDYQLDIKGDYALNVTHAGKITIGKTLDINTVDTVKFTTNSEMHIKSSNNTYISADTNVNVNGGADTFVSAKGNLNMTAADWKVSASGSTNITSGHHVETAGTIDMNGPAAAGASPATAADKAATLVDLPTFLLPNRNKDNGWENGKFYKAEDLSSIMLRVPTFEPWDHHESINKSKFSKDATDLTVATGASTVSSSGAVDVPNPSVAPSSQSNTKYVVPPASSGTPPEKTGNVEQDNIAAFLWMIRRCEGTSGPTGYQTMFTGATFDPNSPTVVLSNLYVQPFVGQPNKAQGFKDHPGLAITAGVNGKGLTSTAAGAYQFLTTTWAACKKQLSLPDFSPSSQDQACILLLKRRGALDDIKAGRFTQAVIKCNKEWASLPGSPYNQHPKEMSVALGFVKQGGGSILA